MVLGVACRGIKPGAVRGYSGTVTTTFPRTAPDSR